MGQAPHWCCCTPGEPGPVDCPETCDCEPAYQVSVTGWTLAGSHNCDCEPSSWTSPCAAQESEVCLWYVGSPDWETIACGESLEVRAYAEIACIGDEWVVGVGWCCPDVDACEFPLGSQGFQHWARFSAPNTDGCPPATGYTLTASGGIVGEPAITVEPCP